MLRVEHQQVGAPAGFQRADRPAEGLGAAGEGLAVEALADRSVDAFSGKHVAALPGEALAVLEPAPNRDGAAREVAVGDDAHTPPGAQVGRGRAEAVAEEGPSGRG